MSACELGWRPARPISQGDLPAHILYLIPIKTRRSLYPTTLTYQRMMNYLLTALRSHAVHHPPNSAETQSRKRPPRRLSRSISIAQRRVRREANKDRRQSEPAHEYALERPWGVAPSMPSMYPPFGVATAPHMFFSSALRGPQHMLSSPLGQHILNYDPPRSFYIPPFAMYDGSSDPYDHMLHFNRAMILNAGDDRFLCKVFPASLKGPALSWFHKLPRGLLNSFSELWAAFVS